MTNAPTVDLDGLFAEILTTPEGKNDPYPRYAAIREHAPAFRSAFGFALGQKGLLDGAVAEFEYAVKLDPDFHEAQFRLGVTRWLRQQYDAAIAPLRASVKLKPDHVESHYYLGLVLQKTGQLR